jgi:hypothetical protein
MGKGGMGQGKGFRPVDSAVPGLRPGTVDFCIVFASPLSSFGFSRCVSLDALPAEPKSSADAVAASLIRVGVPPARTDSGVLRKFLALSISSGGNCCCCVSLKLLNRVFHIQDLLLMLFCLTRQRLAGSARHPLLLVRGFRIIVLVETAERVGDKVCSARDRPEGAGPFR